MSWVAIRGKKRLRPRVFILAGPKPYVHIVRKRAMVPCRSERNIMPKTYHPPLATNPHDPLYRVDKAIRAAQQRLDAAVDAKRHHTSQNLAHEVIKEAREGLKKSEQLRALKLKELAQKAADQAAGK
jgi:hypothetical protein